MMFYTIVGSCKALFTKADTHDGFIHFQKPVVVVQVYRWVDLWKGFPTIIRAAETLSALQDSVQIKQTIVAIVLMPVVIYRLITPMHVSPGEYLAWNNELFQTSW